MKHLQVIWGKLSLSFRVMVGVGLVMALVGVLLITNIVRSDIKMEREQFSQRTGELLDSIRISISEMAVVGDYTTIRQMLRTRVTDSMLDKISWVDPSGNVISEELQGELLVAPKWFQELVGISPIMKSEAIEVGGTSYGAITVNANPTYVINRLYDRFIFGLVTTVAALSIMFAMIVSITSNALRPLKSMVAAARRIETGDYSVRIEPGGSREVREAISSFNSMAAKVNSLLALQRKLAGRMEEVREEQNKSIARELHDSLGGNLTMIKHGLDTLATEAGRDHECQPKIQSLLALSESTLQLARGLTSALRPSMLDSLGVMPTLQWYAKEFSRMTGISCHVELCQGVTCPKNNETAIFRIVQEALTNVARHANASRVSIQACLEDDHLVLEIADNGVGLPSQQAAIGETRSLGVISMRERAQYMQGKLDIISAPGYGTTITLTVPVNQRGTA